MKISLIVVAVLSTVLALTSCATTSDYERQKKVAAQELPAYEQAFRDQDCFNLRFKFVNGMSFGKNDVLNSLKCLELERTRNNLRAQARGIIEDDELTATYAYDNYRAIFTYLSSGELSLKKARELYKYVAEKSRMDAQAEMQRSNQLLAQGLENQRRAWEQENRNRAVFFQTMQSRPKPPIVTTCSALFGVVTCTTQ